MCTRTIIRRLAVLAVLASGLALPATAWAQGTDRPATQPNQRPRPGPAQGQRQGQPPQIGALLGSVADAAASVGLTEEQKAQVEELVARARLDLNELLPRLQQMPPDVRRQELQAVVSGLIEEINAKLSAEQKPQFRAAIERLRDQGPGQRPGSRPASGPQGIGERVARHLQQMSAALREMELTDEQNGKIDAAVAELRGSLRGVAQQHTGDPQQLGEAIRPLLEEFHETIGSILTPEQQAEFSRRLEERAQQPATRPGQRQGEGNPRDGGGANRGGEQGANRGGQGDGAMTDAMAGGMQAMDGADAQRNRPPTSADRTDSAFLERLNAPQGIAEGTTLADSLNIVTLTGKQRPLKSFVPGMQSLIVLMGSASSPTFRDRLADLEWLRHETLRDAEILIIYTREQHAAGEWTVARNEADGIQIPQHADIEARIAAARELRENADLKVEVVVDAMDDAALKALVGDSPHCAAFVFAPGGKLVGRQQWMDPTGIPALVAQAKQRDAGASE